MLVLSNLSVLAYANKFTLWHYKTEDKLSTLLEGNYFGAAEAMVEEGDLIIARTSYGTEWADTKFLAISEVRRDSAEVKVETY